VANNVFANGREISCKKADGKSIAAFPDVCMTPPTAPPTPPGVPVPYPNTAMAKDCAGGSRTVKIAGAEVMLKNKSYFKTSAGDEAGSAPKKGVVSSKIKGKAYFTAWSMDIKFEGENVVRHMDMTTHNHGSNTNGGMTVHIDALAFAVPAECEAAQSAVQEECVDKGGSSVGADGRVQSCSEECAKAQKCLLPPKQLDKEWCCPPANTGHHLVEVNCFVEPSGRGGLGSQIGMSKTNLAAKLSTSGSTFTPESGHSKPIPLAGFSNYDDQAAPTVCADPSVGYTDHGAMHAVTERAKTIASGGELLYDFGESIGGERIESRWTLHDATEAGVEAHKSVHPGCDEECVRAQLNAYHVEKLEIAPDTPVRTDTSQSYPQGRQWLKDSM